MIQVVILAAGKSSRMKSRLNKLTYPLLGLRAIDYISNAVSILNPIECFFIVGNHNFNMELPKDSKRILQHPPRGTGDALRCFLKDAKHLSEHILILPGDIPLITREVIKKFYDTFIEKKLSVGVISTILEHPSGYGRIIRNRNGRFTGIVEEKDADENQKMISEINTGIYLIKSSIITELVSKLDSNNAQGEFYITDIMRFAYEAGYLTGAICDENHENYLGINNPYELAEAIDILKKRKNRILMMKGVVIENPANTFIDWNVEIGSGTVIKSGSHITGSSSIGEYCELGPNTNISDSIIRDETIISNSVIEKSEIKEGCTIGPFSHIRPSSLIERGCKVGNFVEIKKSHLKEGVKASHLSYIGDSEIGKNTNIGCGTITCNYDGKNKHRTEIGENSFIGSNTCLVAPVRLGKNVFTGAGSVITKDVPDDSLGIARGRQVNIENWSKRKSKEN